MARTWVGCFIVGALFAGPSAAEPGVVKVVPPGLDALIGELVGMSDPLAGCRVAGVSVDRVVIAVTYTCADGDMRIELRHPSDAAAPRATTERFALVTDGTTPAALVEALAARLREKEGPFHWISAEAPGLAVPVPDAVPAPPREAPRSFTPEQSEAFVAAAKLYREGRAREAFEAFRRLARDAPQDGTLGMVVATLASTAVTQAEVAAFAAEADRTPDDPLPQFVAGVAAHYCGHRQSRTRGEKRALYAQAIHYLERARPRFDFEPRVFVYLAVSHFRLGHQAEAEALIEAAVPLATNDPDVYYCRGEIFSQKDVPRAIADVRRYLEMTDALAQQGVQHNEAKHRRVQEMLAHLEAVRDGKAQPEELFDPLAEAPHEPPPLAADFFRNPRTYGWATLGLVVASTLVWLGVSRRRSS